MGTQRTGVMRLRPSGRGECEDGIGGGLRIDVRVRKKDERKAGGRDLDGTCLGGSVAVHALNIFSSHRPPVGFEEGSESLQVK